MGKTIKFIGYRPSAEGLEGDLHDAWEMVRSGRPVCRWLACLNPHSFVVAADDKVFQVALSNADILLPDGAGIILGARILGEPIKERVAGFDFFTALTRRANREGGIRYFFLGSTDHVLERLVERLGQEYPQIEVCGTISPPFRESFSEEENCQIVDAVNQARPDVLWVGMTAPKQEKWIHANKDKLHVPFIGAIGAVFDFYSGTRKRAPAWLCNLGLEWLPRLLREPRRLFRRNFISSPVFLFKVLQEKFRRTFTR